ncbi:hypothetical protein D3C86_1833530 [compost metagenome]
MPPAGNGTTMVTGLAGQCSCAKAGAAIVAAIVVAIVVAVRPRHSEGRDLRCMRFVS